MKWILTYFLPMIPVFALAIYLVMLLTRLVRAVEKIADHQADGTPLTPR